MTNNRAKELKPTSEDIRKFSDMTFKEHIELLKDIELKGREDMRKEVLDFINKHRDITWNQEVVLNDLIKFLEEKMKND